MLDASEHHQPPGAASTRRRGLRLALASVVAVGLLGVAASAAQAEAKAENAILTCKTIVVTYTGFPNGPAQNKVTEKVRIDGVQNAVTKTFYFTGPEATDTINIALPAGTHAVDLFSKWKNSNGVSGGRDQFLGKVKCTNAEPELEDEKLQKYSTKATYTKETLKLAHVGYVVDYEIIVRNSGNVPLSLEFSDPHCDNGTITGGPTGPIGRFESTTYFCTHTITQADAEAGQYCNVANVKGTPTEGPIVERETNTVCVEVPNPNNKVEFGCKVIRDYLFGFPAAEDQVSIKIRVDGVRVEETIFKFIGPSAVFEYEVNLPPGHHGLDVFTQWNTHGFKGGTDQTIVHGVTCAAEPDFSIEKRQKIEGSPEPFTTSTLEGSVGQTVDYEVVLTNTGNTSLTFGPLNDPKCDEGTIEGGPGNNPVEPAGPKKAAGTTTFFCKHTITLQDEIAGEYTNSASETGTPPEGQGEPVTKESKTVSVHVIGG